MGVLRFDFEALQDFRLPPKPKEAPLAALELTAPVEEAPPPPPTFSEAELEAAKRSEFQRGKSEGKNEGHTQAQNEDSRRNMHIESMLERLAQEIATLHQRHLAMLRIQSEDVSQLVLMIARKVAGDAIALAPQKGIESMVENCLNVLMHQPKMVLHVHPSIESSLVSRLRARLHQAGVEGELHLQTDESLQPGEGRLEWRDGMAERNIASLWSKIESMLSNVNFVQQVDQFEEPQTIAPITNKETQTTDIQEKGENHE